MTTEAMETKETESLKRKEPEPTEAEPKATVAVAVKGAASTEEPDSKRLKSTPCDPAVVRKQVEYYLSDDNLNHDKFFHEAISKSDGGWLDMSLVLSCNKMKAMRATKEDVLNALKESKVEVREDQLAVRRPGNAALPKLEVKFQKKQLHAHDGGVLAVFKDIPAEQSWMQVKEKLKEAMPEKTQLWYVSQVSDKNQCIVASSPFDGDQEFFDKLELEVAGAKLKPEVCWGEILQQSLKLLPKNIRDKREKEARKRQKDRNRPIVIGTQRFVNMGALRGRVKEILNSRSDGETLKPDGGDFKLMKGIIGYHPKGEEKSRGMTGIKVSKSQQGESRCFYMIKEGGVEEDFSAKKCLDAIELNPPYAVDAKTEAAAKADAAPKAAAKAEAAATSAAEEKPAEKAETEEAKPAEKAETPAAAEGAKPAEEAADAEKA
eukprot:gnl/TRDRNA2_/TRDRNA2_178216_c0_seq1.p1 gnl/TRDRNA2_/TRDRNA2_178216_c0~~gnl/TRDRNA2_/TRDRNA2_178216_c0_seq1.p1  ORF type:complete len:434 (+),score=146.63 gnl/TRDRNA2_/TRDRNA2_178216_c0_seq1:77-1378(+)